MRNKKLIPFTILTAMTIPVATIASGSIHASGTIQDELHEAVEDAYEDLRELASDGAPQDAIDAVKAEIDALMRNALAEIASGERVNPDRFEDAVEDLVDALEDRFETSSRDTDDDRDDDDNSDDRDDDNSDDRDDDDNSDDRDDDNSDDRDDDNSDDRDDDDNSDDRDDDDISDEIAERYEDIEEAIAKATRAIDAAETLVDAELITEVRATLAALIERANQADLTSRQLKDIRDDIRAIAKRFRDYLESDDDDDHDSDDHDSDDHDEDDSADRHGFERVVEVMQIRAEKFDGEKKERFEARTEEFRIRYETAADGESRRKVVEQERDNRIEEAKAQVTNLITRISDKLDDFANVDATDETLTAVRALQGALDRIASQVQTAETREDLRAIRDLINAEREEIGRLFIILEDLTEISDDTDGDDTTENTEGNVEEPSDATSTTEVTS